MKNQTRIGLLLLIVFSTSLFAKTVKITRDTDVYQIQNNKAVRTGRLKANTSLNMVGTRGHGKFVEVNYQGKVCFVRTEATNWAGREITSTGSTEGSSSDTFANGKSPLAMNVGGELEWGTSLGIGFGVHFGVVPRSLVSSMGYWEGQLGFAYFPSVASASSTTTVGLVSASATGYTLGAYARYNFLVAPKIYVGPEVGLAMVESAATTTLGTLGAVSASATSFAASLGGFTNGSFAKDWGWFGGLRLYTTGGLAFLGGVQYLF